MNLSVEHMMAAAIAVIDTVSVNDAIALVDDPDVVFIDLRDSSERAENGMVPGAVSAPRGYLEFFADPQTAMHNPVFTSGKRLILFCASGGRSMLAVKTLHDMGIARVAHIAGGFGAWHEASGPIGVSTGRKSH